MKQYVILFVLLLYSLFAVAQSSAISVPYVMNFEESDSTELKNWVINPGADADQCTDHWIVGEATHSDGKRALYIATKDTFITTNATDAAFGSKPCVQYVYRDFVLPRGTYVITFDWRCMGSADANLYAGVGPAESMPEMDARYNVATFPSDLSGFILDECFRMHGNTRWSNTVIDAVTKTASSTTYITSNGKRPIRLFFLWTNNNHRTDLQVPLGACIDNIQITNANCLIPEVVEAEIVNCDSLRVKWLGASEDYELQYRRSDKQQWTKVGIVSSVEGEEYTSCILENLEENLYNFRVRGICHGDSGDVYSAYRYLNNYVFYCPDKHFINYMDLQDSTTTCYYGTFLNPQENAGIVDYGPDDAYSRHTVIWDMDATDSRTSDQLKMVPDNSFASVRLGNWLSGAQAEAITYKVHVDKEKAGILLLRYAMVMQDPGHDDISQPRFKIEILEESPYGDWQLVNQCGVREFVSNSQNVGNNGWHSAPGTGIGNVPTLWREWTTIGLDIQDYHNKDILIRLTNYDCSQSGHFGYAYFSLDFQSAKITSNSCGEESEIAINAPDGFTYQWYSHYGTPQQTPVPHEMGGDSISLILSPSDTTTYTCELASRELPQCFFTLSTSSKARFPYSDFVCEYAPVDCQNKIRLHNRSHILTKYNNEEQHHMDEECQNYEWTMLNTSVPSDTIYSIERNPVLNLPNEGGLYWITLTSFIADGVCHHDTTLWIDIPKIGDTETVFDSTICDGAYLVLGDKFSDKMHYAADPGTYHVTWKSMAGCDSTHTYNLFVHPQDKIVLPDTTICAEEPLCIDGECYKQHETGSWVRFKTNMYGCDSTIWMAVTVEDSILPHVTMTDIVDDQEYSGAFDISGTGYDYFTLNGQRYEATTERIDSLNGGEFELIFYNDFGCEIRQLHSMKRPCVQMIMQRWGDVLSVINQQKLGDVHPVSFQWMRDGVDIPGETRSYYYAPEGLSLTSVYAMRIVTEAGEEIVSCDLQPTSYQQKQAPAATKQIRNGQLEIIVNKQTYNAQGEKLR